MSSRFLVARFAVTVVLALCAAWLGACQVAPDVPREPIVLALPPLEQNALVYIADDTHLFDQYGLQVSIKDYDTGAASINAILDGEADIAEAAEFPFVRAWLEGQPIRIIACNDKFENDFVVARKDRGVLQVADLKGKRIGVTKQSIAEFYLYRFLQLNRIASGEVTIVHVPPAQFTSALEGDNLDALVAWEPHVTRILEKQGSSAVSWSVQSNQAVFGVLVAKDGWLATRGETTVRFLKALSDAEVFAVRNPMEAQKIVRNRLGYDAAYVADIWSHHHFSLSLDFSLIAALEDEAHWLNANNLTMQTKIPDLLDAVYTDSLKRVKVGAVNIAR